MVKRIFKMADGVLIVYDITDKESFESMDRWLE
jgi:GTPase SAR1 family protein